MSEIHIAPVATGADLPSVEERGTQKSTKTANGQFRGTSLETVGSDPHDPLERFSDGQVGQIANLFANNGIADYIEPPLRLQRIADGARNFAGYDDLVFNRLALGRSILCCRNRRRGEPHRRSEQCKFQLPCTARAHG